MHPPVNRRVAVVSGLTALAALAVPGVLATGSPPAGAASAPTQTTPQAEYQAAIKAASNQGVHFVSVASPFTSPATPGRPRAHRRSRCPTGSWASR